MPRFRRPRLLPLVLSFACRGSGSGDEPSATDPGEDTGTAEGPGTQSATGSDATATGGTDSVDEDSSGDPTTDTGGPGPCGAIETFEDGKTPTREIHVAPHGRDTAECGDEGSPCATIEHAAGLASPGMAVRIHAGTYAADNYIANLAGTSDAPIWIGGAPGEDRPVIEGGGEGLHFSTVRWLVVHDLEVRNASGNGINTDDGEAYDDPDATRYVVFRNLFIHDIGAGGNQDCLKLSGVDDYWVLDSEFARCGGGGSGSAIDHVGCHHGLVARNLFRDLQDAGNAVQCKGGSEDIEIRANVMVDPGQRGVNMGGSTGFEFFRPPLSETEPNAEARDIRVIANYIRGGTAPLAFVGCDGCLAANNTIVDPENWILRILQETMTDPPYTFVPARNGRLVNNLVYFSRAGISTWVNIGGDTDPETFAFTANLWYAHDDPGQSDPASALPVPETGGLYGQDPLLVDPSSSAEIDPGSPAVGAGTPLGELEADAFDHCWADPPSIGAHEGAP